MSDIFVSYASEDLDRVKPLIAAFEERGWSVWWDRQLVAGPNYQDKIEEALDGARCVVVAWSGHSIKSQWVKTEANEGLDRNILIPLLIDDVKPPLAFRIAQTAKMIGWPDQTGQLDSVLDGITLLIGDKDRTSSEQKSIAVLPFTNMSHDPDQVYFSDGMAEEIINGLIRFPNLKVIARTSSFQYRDNSDIREIGHHLNVSHVLEGSVRRAGDRIRVSAQLIVVSDETNVWSNQYDRDLVDVFEVQDELTNEILKSLYGQLVTTTQAPPRRIDKDAYDFYLKARKQLAQENFVEAENLLQEALALNSDYADAYAYLGVIHHVFAFLGSSHDLEDEYVEKALEKNPKQSIAQAIRAFKLFYRDRNYQQGIEVLSELVTEQPYNTELLAFYAETFIPIGQIQTSVRVIRRMVELDPVSPNPYLQLARGLNRAEEFDEALECLERYRMLGGKLAHSLLTDVALKTENFAIAEAQLSLGAEAWGPMAPFHQYYELLFHMLQGNLTRKNQILAEMTRSNDPLPAVIAVSVAVISGKTELALDCCENALEAGDILMFRALRRTSISHRASSEFYSHPGYKKLLTEFGLDDDSISRLQIPHLPF